MTQPLPGTETVDLDDMATWISALRQVHTETAALETQLREKRALAQRITEEIQTRLGDAVEGRVNGRTVVTYHWNPPRQLVDVKRLRQELPDVAEAYTRTSTPTRKFQLLDDSDDHDGEA